jgi:hypothetical protein
LTAAERKEIVFKPFRAEAALVSGVKIQLREDGATTRAIISACANASLDTGVRTVCGLASARALLQHGLSEV